MQGAQLFGQELEKALDESDVVVVVWSKASITSEWVRNEAGEGLRRGILVPALLDDVAPPLEFRAIQSADLRRDPERGLARLVEAVTRITLGAPGANVSEAPVGPALAKGRPPLAFGGWRAPAAVAAMLAVMAMAATLFLSKRLEGPAPPAPSPSTQPGPTTPKTFRVPNFVGSQSVDAQNTAKLLSLRLVITDEQGKQFSSLEGVVTGQTPVADQEVAEGTPVRLAISTSVVTAPTVVGMNLNQALAALLRAKLELGTTESKYVRDAREGTIIEQSPAPGTRVPAGSRVNVTVATQAPPSRRRSQHGAFPPPPGFGEA